jgi:hypothetical protein
LPWCHALVTGGSQVESVAFPDVDHLITKLRHIDAGDLGGKGVGRRNGRRGYSGLYACVCAPMRARVCSQGRENGWQVGSVRECALERQQVWSTELAVLRSLTRDDPASQE